MATNNAINIGTGTAGEVLTSNGPGAAPTFQAAAGGGANYPVMNKDITNTLYYYGYPSGYSGSTISVSDKRLYIVPFSTPVDITLTNIVVNITVAVAGAIGRIGIYNESSGLPSALIDDCGTFSAATTGIKECATTETLSSGTTYFFAVTIDENSGAISMSKIANVPIWRTSSDLTTAALFYIQANVDPTLSLPSTLSPTIAVGDNIPCIAAKLV